MVREVEEIRTELRAAGPAEAQVLNTATSHCWSPGLRSRLRGALPNVPSAGSANASGLRKKLLSWCRTRGELFVRVRIDVANQIDRLTEKPVAHTSDIVAARRRERSARAHQRRTRDLPPAQQISQ